MKKIALDLDGVVFDSENLYRVYTEMYDVDVLKRDSLIDNSKRTFQKRYKWSDEEIQDFCDKNVKKIIDTAKFMTGFELAIKKLKERYDFVVITARTDYQALIAKKAFENIGLGDIKIFNNEHSKIEKILEEKVDYIIDDDDIICSNAADNGVCALYFKNNAATKMEKDNVININNWGEIYKYLMLNERDAKNEL